MDALRDRRLSPSLAEGEERSRRRGLEHGCTPLSYGRRGPCERGASHARGAPYAIGPPCKRSSTTSPERDRARLPGTRAYECRWPLRAPWTWSRRTQSPYGIHERRTLLTRPRPVAWMSQGPHFERWGAVWPRLAAPRSGSNSNSLGGHPGRSLRRLRALRRASPLNDYVPGRNPERMVVSLS
jgi:hypothetical protein